ncbi:TPA: type II secretion system minor pseudopilin GspH [Serratia fonticola]
MARRTDRRQRGFTLLEMMLVVVLIGITGTLALGRLSADRGLFTRPAATLMATLYHAREQATRQEALYGLALAQNGWQLMIYRGDRWHRAQQPSFTLPAQMEMALQIEQQSISLPARLTSSAEPQLWIFPGGETSVFALNLLQGHCSQRFTANGFMTFQRDEVRCNEE